MWVVLQGPWLVARLDLEREEHALKAARTLAPTHPFRERPRALPPPLPRGRKILAGLAALLVGLPVALVGDRGVPSPARRYRRRFKHGRSERCGGLASRWPDMPQRSDNSTTDPKFVRRAALGRLLFFDPVLSGQERHRLRHVPPSRPRLLRWPGQGDGGGRQGPRPRSDGRPGHSPGNPHDLERRVEPDPVLGRTRQGSGGSGAQPDHRAGRDGIYRGHVVDRGGDRARVSGPVRRGVRRPHGVVDQSPEHHPGPRRLRENSALRAVALRPLRGRGSKRPHPVATPGLRHLPVRPGPVFRVSLPAHLLESRLQSHRRAEARRRGRGSRARRDHGKRGLERAPSRCRRCATWP